MSPILFFLLMVIFFELVDYRLSLPFHLTSILLVDAWFDSARDDLLAIDEVPPLASSVWMTTSLVVDSLVPAKQFHTLKYGFAVPVVVSELFTVVY